MSDSKLIELPPTGLALPKGVEAPASHPVDAGRVEATVDTRPMQDPNRVVGCDGTRYYFRRRLAHEASRDVVARNIERGWFLFERAEGDVEVYLVSENAPHRARQVSPDEAAINQLLDELILAAQREDVANYYDGLQELAYYVKGAGRPGQDFNNLVGYITTTAEQRTKDYTLGARLRYAIRAEAIKRKGTVLVLPRSVQ